MTSHMTEIAEE